MRFAGIDHVSITTGDLQRSLAFYRDLLGLPVLSVGEATGEDIGTITGFPGARALYADLDLGEGQVLELLEYVEPAGVAIRQRTCDPGSGHLSFVVDGIDEYHATLAAAGATVRSKPIDLHEGGHWDGTRVMYVVDPDGVTLELLERTSTVTVAHGGGESRVEVRIDPSRPAAAVDAIDER
jgi:glyoxylase I family protein